MVTFITGGIKSGKTKFGLKIGQKYQKKVYIATAEPFDEEMKKKIDLHRAERGVYWETIEEPINLDDAVKRSLKFDLIMIDCITVWLNNLLYHQKNVEEYIYRFILSLNDVKNEVVIISNEIGMGVVPIEETARNYLNLLGIINQRIASISDNLVFMVSGYPLFLKGDLNNEL
ncbi:bifunctional adenosylcobinamide kinase/adenosylcobinamide-phosphate guanylyltransferase [Calditerrivibrio nitroreducens]|uniref:Adenosylcobinamide kinase n=1 Tax=Calditerrivibrio nitroreducens (strain DSM 19672 / NBRC 101217 / Yu37-1) TaxID=768670 RepID=E4TGZ1_CALNY|nr:bifunctional adenosylcobinamide kinase/adenosylcobinamide-phosphate guanylyltransferase [Calditerrivibrio nitroreducens]ADR19789.1 Adenosylcobinamide-phosphate guanylyl transferase [Calditerrivibrio nitroreducens DSM 19672]